MRARNLSRSTSLLYVRLRKVSTRCTSFVLPAASASSSMRESEGTDLQNAAPALAWISSVSSALVLERRFFFAIRVCLASPFAAQTADSALWSHRKFPNSIPSRLGRLKRRSRHLPLEVMYAKGLPQGGLFCFALAAP